MPVETKVTYGPGTNMSIRNYVVARATHIVAVATSSSGSAHFALFSFSQWYTA